MAENSEKPPRAPRTPPLRRDQFVRLTPLTMRWKDVDAFGHVNNVEYYSYFDTAVVEFLVSIGAFAARESPHAAMIVESGARFHRELGFGDTITVGMAVDHLGTSSLRYRLGVFGNADTHAAADGFFVHVFVDRATRRPIPIPEPVRRELSALML